MTLYEEIVAKCTAGEIASRNYHFLAAKVSENRTKTIKRTGEIGNGTILESLGLGAGNALLDVIHSNPAFKYVIPLLEQGRLILDSPLVQGTLASLVGDQIAAGITFSQGHIDALNILSVQPDPVTWTQVQAAVEAGV